MTFLCYSALIRSLPSSLRKEIDKAWLANPNIPHRINITLNHKTFSRYAYSIFVAKASENNVLTNRNLKTKWKRDISNYSEGTLQRVVRATMSSYLIYLHFRIVNRTYATNKYLLDINIKESSVCSFCKERVETIVHLFWYCSKTEIFIKEVLSHIKINYSVTMDVDAVKWFFLTELSDLDVTVIMLMKSCIHKARMKGKLPCASAMLQSLKLEAVKEHHIAQMKNQECMFEQKWGKLAMLAV